MDDDIPIIELNTRKEKIKNFLFDNKKKLIIFFVVIILTVVLFFGYGEFIKIQNKKISNLYYSTTISFDKNNKEKTAENLIKIINKKDSTYSPLSLYFILDNQLINDRNQINDLFEILINKTSLNKEIKNLIIYKKGLYNADQISENELLNILNPIIKTKSVWNSHALYLLAEYFYSKNQKQKSKEFFSQIINLKNPNPDILVEAQKRLNRDLSD
tara:strand:- start:3370 stop:4014 length:645 start_codon:yes stop_codon:yes gene_type:complete